MHFLLEVKFFSSILCLWIKQPRFWSWFWYQR